MHAGGSGEGEDDSADAGWSVGSYLVAFREPARTMILREPPEQLARYLDLPWCRADLFYLQKLIACLDRSIGD